MPPYLQMIIYALALSCVIMTLVWWRQVYTKNAGIVDGWWSYNFGFIAILYQLLSTGDPVRNTLITLMVITWSFRLGTHLLIRNTKHTDEDTRYRKLRAEYGVNENFYMWRFFMYQAFSNVLLSLPFLLISLDQSSELTFWIWVGISVWIIAIAGESLADHQLKKFKEDAANQGKVCEIGLWNYSRHPNYFFEWMIWISYAIMAWGSPHGWIAILCPILMYLLLNKVTGIPMLEDLAVKSKGKPYLIYQQTTSAFFPWFKKAIK